MKKKILSFLCALAVFVSMTVIGTVVASADSKANAQFSGLDKATCVIPENLSWNSSGSGLFKTELQGDGVIIGGQSCDLSLTADLGYYSISDYFKADFDIWYGTRGINEGGKAGNENFIVSFGDISITFTRSPESITNGNGRNIYLQSVTYKGQEVALVGERNFVYANLLVLPYNDESWIGARQDFSDFCEENMIRVSWMFQTNQYFWPQNNLGVEVTFDSGTLTIKNTTGTATNTITADLSTVAGFNAQTSLNVSKLTFTVDCKAERQTFVSIISDFHGEYKKGPNLPAELLSPAPPSSTAPSSTETSSTETSSTVESSDATSSDASSGVSSSKADSSAATSSKDSAPAGTTDTDTDDGNDSNIVTVIIIVVAACVIVAGGVVAFLLLRKKNANVEEELTEKPTEKQGE